MSRRTTSILLHFAEQKKKIYPGTVIGQSTDFVRDSWTPTVVLRLLTSDFFICVNALRETVNNHFS